MCGGSLEIHPCSHVAHLFRSMSPYKWGKSFRDILRKNAVRTAEVWMDEYKHIYYERLNYDLVCDQIEYLQAAYIILICRYRSIWMIIINLKKKHNFNFASLSITAAKIFLISNFDQVYMNIAWLYICRAIMEMYLKEKTYEIVWGAKVLDGT